MDLIKSFCNNECFRRKNCTYLPNVNLCQAWRYNQYMKRILEDKKI